MGQKKPVIFAREATGLVRSVSPISAVIFSIANTGYLFATYFDLTIFPSLGTPTDLLGGFLISIVATLCITYVYYHFAILAPRTGGDYVWITRWLNPILGFVSTLVGLVIVEFLYIGLTAVEIQATGLSMMFAMVGSTLHNAGLVALAPSLSSPTNIFILGTIEIWVPGLLVLMGAKFYFKAQNVVYAFIFLIMAVLFGIMATMNPTQYSQIFNTYSQPFASSPTYYTDIINTATKSGWAPPVENPWNMLMFVPLLIPTVAFGLLSYIGGEVKSTRKTWGLGLFGGSLSWVAFSTAAPFLAYHAFGFQFMSAIAYLFYNDPSAIVLPALPYINYLTAIAVFGSPILVILLALSVIQQIYYQPAATMATSRALFAFSFDRLAPDRLASVNNRWNSPLYAVLVTLLLSEACLIFFDVPMTSVYAYYFVAVAALIAMVFPYFMLGLTAVIFPYRFREQYAQGAMKGAVAGLPTLVWAGIGTLFFTGMSMYLLLTQPVFGANSPYGLGVFAVGIMAAIILYALAWTVRKRQGLDLKYVYSQIPPE